MQVKAVIAILVVCLSLSAIVRANDNDPEKAVKAYWAAMQQQDWNTAVSMVHPKSLKRIREATDKYVSTLLSIDKYGDNLRTQFGVSTKQEYDGLSDQVVLERVLQRMALEPGFVEILKATTCQIIGNTKQREDLVHILYRTEIRLLDAQGNRLKTATFTRGNQFFSSSVTVNIPAQDDDRADILSVRREGTMWLVLLGNEVEDTLAKWEDSLKDFIRNMQRVSTASIRRAKAKTRSRLKSPTR